MDFPHDDVYEVGDDCEGEYDDAYDAEAGEEPDPDDEDQEKYSEACAAYEQARSNLREQQKRRGFFRAEGTLTFDERQSAIRQAKPTSSCGACGQRGHWAGDPSCPKAARLVGNVRLPRAGAVVRGATVPQRALPAPLPHASRQS